MLTGFRKSVGLPCRGVENPEKKLRYDLGFRVGHHYAQVAPEEMSCADS